MNKQTPIIIALLLFYLAIVVISLYMAIHYSKWYLFLLLLCALSYKHNEKGDSV